MTRVLLVPDLPLERWPSMDRYAHRLHDWLESTDPGFEVRLAASIGDLTRERRNGATRGAFHGGWPRAGTPPSLFLPGRLTRHRATVPAYVRFPWCRRRRANAARLVLNSAHSSA